VTEIRPLLRLERAELEAVITGYTSPARYRVHREESDEAASFRLELVNQPYVKRFDLPDASFDEYQRLLPEGLSLGAYDADKLVGAALAERRTWNGSLFVHEFHVAEGYRGRGLGARLMDSLAERARAAGLRVLVCETQTTNVPAVRFYRRVGFMLDGIDLSLYSNDDWPDGEIALYMKRKL
jgi:ribosomal protein S18 acetylase RimI-like enzyme